MKHSWRRVVQFPIITAVTILATVTTPGAASAVGAGLWHCSPFSDGRTYACTTITSAPAAGVQVLDHATAEIRTLYNGNSIALQYWHTDESGLCGVANNPYVWVIAWQNQGWHFAYIGDHYLNTGKPSNWWTYTDYLGELGNDRHNAGPGSGTCDNFP